MYKLLPVVISINVLLPNGLVNTQSLDFDNIINNFAEKIKKNDGIFDQYSIIKKINSMKTTWRAGKNFPTNITRSEIIHLSGTHLEKRKVGTRPVDLDCGRFKLPLNFDARKQWGSMCPTLRSIPNQGKCGSCWAVSTAATFTDRLCIISRGENKVPMAAQELLSCAMTKGCGGGYASSAWLFIKRYGLVTGSEYDSNQGCQPYLIPPLKWKLDQKTSSFPDMPMTPECLLRCYNQKYEKPYNKDKQFLDKILELDYCDAMKSIYESGPIQASFLVYEDFLTYKEGIYQHRSGKYIDGHSVKVIGWGINKGVRYWLVINSWGKEWGDGGTFKIMRGTNECGFENKLTGGEPKYKK